MTATIATNASLACTAGFSNTDLWAVYSDCHVNLVAKAVLLAFNIFVSALLLARAIAILCMIGSPFASRSSPQTQTVMWRVRYFGNIATMLNAAASIWVWSMELAGVHWVSVSVVFQIALMVLTTTWLAILAFSFWIGYAAVPQKYLPRDTCFSRVDMGRIVVVCVAVACPAMTITQLLPLANASWLGASVTATLLEMALWVSLEVGTVMTVGVHVRRTLQSVREANISRNQNTSLDMPQRRLNRSRCVILLCIPLSISLFPLIAFVGWMRDGTFSSRA